MRALKLFTFGALLTLLAASPARAQGVERLCDPAFEDCRQVLINYIRAEKAGLDLAFWFMEDAWIASEVINRHKAGVPVRVLMDTQANSSTPRNAERLAELKAAGVPMREKVTGGILHWKMMLFSGQNIVEFSGANFSSDAWVYSGSPYTNYVDEAIYFTSDNSVVNSFRTKFDDLWVNTTGYANYANITTPLTRNYGIFPKDPALNFPPLESFADRSVNHYNLERQKLDVIIYRITDQRHTNAVINAAQRGIPVRLITEPKQYRDPLRLWHSWNVDRLYMAGVQIRDRAHAGLNHQKMTLYYSQGMSVLGSSNWTTPSDNSQEEHNYFTTKPHLFTWLVDHFERKWNNQTGIPETAPFTPLPPDAATTPFPANSEQGVKAASVTLKWQAGFWAHNYDIYFGTSPQPPLLAADQMLGPSQSAVDYKQYTVPTALQPGTTYYWRIVSKTMANKTATSPVFTFSTEGSTPPPPPPPPPGAADIVLHAGKATGAGAWRAEADTTAASRVKMRHPDAGGAKVTSASASPRDYFELTFTAEAGVPYRLWVRGRADANYWPNDSAFVQFSGSVDSSGAAMWRIGSTSATEVSLEECSACGVSEWGWQDNGWGAGVLGPLVYFATTGAQKIRVQTREDGFAIDQIVLSPSTYMSSAPGPNKNDTTILPEQGGGTGSTPPPPPVEGDTTAPTAQITSPSAGATVSGTTNVAVTAADNVAVARVEMLLDGTVVASDSAAPYQFAWDTSGATNAAHTLQARAIDSSGNAGTSAIVTVTVSNTVTQSEEIVLWAADATARAGAWRLVADATAAAGLRMHHPEAGAGKVTTAAAAPANYFEVRFNAVAGRPYRIWLRGKADGNYWANDSVFLQFSGSIDANGSSAWRIGTTSALEVNLEECSGCGVADWGWQDNGWGAGVLGPVVYFNTTGPQVLRIQTREDGFSIDQIVLSPSKYQSTAPGTLKNDNTILGKTQ